MTDSAAFDTLDQTLDNQGPQAMLEQLAARLRTAERYHELFEVLKLTLRLSLGLSLIPPSHDERLNESQREALESGLVGHCRDVGLQLLRGGRIREAWHYLRAVGDREQVGQELASLVPNETNREEFLELWLHEGLDYDRGFTTLLEHYGTCNAITTFDSVMYGKPRVERAAAARPLVAYVHHELLANLRAHRERLDGELPAAASVPELLDQRPELFADQAHHLDTTHLASVVRFARDTLDRSSWTFAWELAFYGQRLADVLQYPGEPPFEQLYSTSERYFRALLGDDVESTVVWFRERAESCDAREETTAVIETYVDLLARLGRGRLAIDEHLRLIPAGVPVTGRCPSLFELAEACGDFTPLMTLSRQRGDLVSYAISRLRAAKRDDH